jgi:hypothetical protein
VLPKMPANVIPASGVVKRMSVAVQDRCATHHRHPKLSGRTSGKRQLVASKEQQYCPMQLTRVSLLVHCVSFLSA